VRCAEFYRNSVDGIEPDDIDGECHRATALRHDFDGPPGDCDGRNENVSLRGCTLRGASTASGSQGGTVFLYSGTGAMVQVGDPTYAADTMGFHLDNAVINTTSAASATAQGFLAYGRRSWIWKAYIFWVTRTRQA